MARISLTLLIAMALLGLPVIASAAAPEQLSVEANEGEILLTRYAADVAGPRSAVLVLHGARGIERKPRAYVRYAERLAEEGIDVYLVSYFTAADREAFAADASARDRREAYEAAGFDGWAKRVASVVTAILSRPDCSGNIGLLGFSLGGYVAADTAARDERISALAVMMYGGMPDAMVPEVKHLPPLIELHGEADRNVPPAKGEELVKPAKAIGVEAEFVGYPGKTHGFDFSDTDPMTADALGRVVGFFEARLLTATPIPASDSPRTPPAAQP
jgi:carboxymethylenebutenolidase